MNEHSNENILHSEVEINGSLKFSNKLQFNGKIDGEVQSTGSLFIGKTGKITGNVKVKEAVIEGEVEGNITSEDKVELKSNAKVIGDIKAAKLAIEEGVTFCGKCEVNPQGVSMDDFQSKFSKKAPESVKELSAIK